LKKFCELLFDILTFLGVYVIESLINREQKLDSKKFFWKNSKCSVIGLQEFFKKNFDFFKINFCSPFIKDSIKGTTENVKMSNKSSQKFSKIDFSMTSGK
jgi:hypothetical protein